ncbi:MAG: ComEC/Rec2 family competence protein [Candidatus Gracilibacteria bacterium]|nr:ComEC/Rec2 family competence protein [Candidatus Gracilibacteria bacterium]
MLFFSSIFGIIIGQINYNNINYKQLKLENITNNYSSEISLELQIINTYKKYENYTSYIGKIITINNEKIDNINLLINFSPKENLYQNDKIIVDTKVDKINNFVSTFDYENFMKSKNIYGSLNIYFLEKEKIIRGKSGFIYKTRQKMLDAMSTIFPEQEANLLSGILIGSRQNLSKNLQENFNNSGLTHIIAVSGYNITIIILFVGIFIVYLPYFLRPFIVALFIIIFVLLVGLEPPVLRAAIMGGMGFFVLLSGRENNSITLLILSAAIIALFNPFILNFDISFWLSFLSVLGLTFIYPLIENKFERLPRFIRDNFSLAISAFVFNLPILIYFFGEISIIFIISNLFVLFAIPFAMLFGFMAIILSFVNIILGKIIGFIAYFFLHYIILMVNFFGELPFAKINLDFGFLNIYFLVLYYLIIGIFLLNKNKKTAI